MTSNIRNPTNNNNNKKKTTTQKQTKSKSKQLQQKCPLNKRKYDQKFSILVMMMMRPFVYKL